MTIYDLKPKFQSLLRPIVNYLYTKGFTANSITIYAIFLSMFGGLLVGLSSYSENYLILIAIPFIMFIRMALNAIDGMLAKEHNMISKEGGILNEMGDVISDILLYLPFALILNPIIVIIFVLLSILSEFIGVLGQAIYSDRRYDGPMGKSDRAFLIGLTSLLIIFKVPFIIINILFVISILLLIYTIYNRWTRMILNENKKD